ncbi:glycosyltransferase [Aquipluma nitroreducens]|uniref:Glycosyltransferase n=1 Tax=Aquipluma nitroreducens TaxID=2010828 RepID=A0A5K7SC31_9BACT|nr:glycosyltransferase family 4 protein [Aquipluma nitroreducens]BBE19151.1 glycosyltransferase [Aquipluma nitroreducens]
MRILQLMNKVPWPPKDGGAIACLNMTKGFSMLGHEVTVLSMNTSKHHIRIKDMPDDVKSKADFRLVEVPASINWLEATLNLLFSKLPYNAQRFISDEFSNELAKLLTEKTFDVIQLEGLYLCPYIPVIREYSKALIVYRAHNIEYEIWERTATLSDGFRSKYLRNLSKRIKRFEISYLNSYDLLVPITDRDGIILDKLGNTKPRHTSQTGIDFASLVPTARKLEFPSLFHIGALDWAPNQEGLIWFFNHCWPKIHQENPDLKFYLAGRNAPEWFERIIKLDGVVYLGEINDAYDFINSKAVMVVPLFSGSGMRIKIIEGMALGKPIVTTDIGTEGIPTESGKNILIANDADSFTEAINQLITDRSLSDRIGTNAIGFIQEKYDNLSQAEALVEFYKQQ